MTVYRIQSKQDKRRGCYGSLTMFSNRSEIVRKMLLEHGDWRDETRPPPTGDAGIERYMESDEHCGFDSAAKLLRWFRGFIPDLLRAGYEIVALQNVEITAIGEYQVLFKWNEQNTSAYGTTANARNTEQLASIKVGASSSDDMIRLNKPPMLTT